MFNEIIKVLNERGAMSVKELSLALQTDCAALHPMLDMLARKQKIEKLDLPCGGGCSSCNCSDVDSLTYYKSK